MVVAHVPEGKTIISVTQAHVVSSLEQRQRGGFERPYLARAGAIDLELIVVRYDIRLIEDNFVEEKTLLQAKRRMRVL